ncbi:MAG: hypothetical protein M9883_08180 [Methylobacteriaceae bacterium]|nr:hypothetical protein [Methylobacteriaceae bacterium]
MARSLLSNFGLAFLLSVMGMAEFATSYRLVRRTQARERIGPMTSGIARAPAKA